MKKQIAVHWQYGAATHTGWYRTLNEDRSLLRIGSTGEGRPYAAAVLADGMGGTEDGGGASELAVDRVKEWLDGRIARLLDAENRWSVLERELKGLFERVHAELAAGPQQQGTTLTLLLLSDYTYMVAHIGDCRVLRLHPSGRWSLLTRDHTWVQRQVRLRRITVREAVRHPKRHVLLQSLGMGGKPVVEFRTGVYSPHSLFVLSSDGFHDCFTTRALAVLTRRELMEENDLQLLCDKLLERALAKRAEDNVSLLLLRPTGEAASALKLWRLYGTHACLRLKKIHKLIPDFKQK